MPFILKISKYYIIDQFLQQSGEFFAFQHLAIRHFVYIRNTYSCVVFGVSHTCQTSETVNRLVDG